MKKTRKTIIGIIAAILCVALLAPVTILGTLAADDTLKLVVASDLHVIPATQYGKIGPRNGLPDSGVYCHVNNTKAALGAESNAIFKKFLSDLGSTSSKYVLLTGDIVDMGSESAHEYVVKELAKVEQKTGKEILVIPGNNDVCYSFGKDKFAEAYKDFGYSDALARHEGSLSYTYDLGSKYRLIAIDSTIYTENKKVDTGEISADLLSWIDEQAAQATAEGRYPIAMMHHNVLKHTRGIGSLALDFVKDAFLKAPENLAKNFADAGIKYVFSGHIHNFDISSKATFKGNSIYEVVTGSLSAYPCAYRRVNFTDSSVSFSTKYINGIDKSYLPGGYTDEQLQAIKAGLKGYAYGVAETSVKFTVKEYIGNPSAIINKLNINGDSKLAAQINEIMPVIYDYIGRPIYTQDPADGRSFEEIAKNYRYDIPASEYQTVYDILGKILTSHMEGDENIQSNNVEIVLLKNIIKMIFLETFKEKNIDVSAFAEKLGLGQVKENMYNYAGSFNFKETVANKLADIFLESTIEGITVDAYEPDDNNAVLPSYTAESIIPHGAEAVYITLIKILEFFARIIHTLFHIV